jgi:hypothetical protein
MDNQSAMALTQTSEYRRRTKHIDISYHFFRDEAASSSSHQAHKTCGSNEVATASEPNDPLRALWSSLGVLGVLGILGAPGVLSAFGV